MFWYFLLALAAIGVGLFAMIGVSVVKDDRREALVPRSMFFVNLAPLLLIVSFAVRFGDWLGQQINAETRAAIDAR